MSSKTTGGKGNWENFQYKGVLDKLSDAGDVVEQYTPEEAHSMIKTLCVIHTAFDIIVEKARSEAGLVGGRAGISLIFNLNLQKYISWNTQNNSNELLSSILFPGKVTDEEGTIYPLGLVGYCNVNGRQQLCQIISPYDKVRNGNVNAVKQNKGRNIKKLAENLTVDANAWLHTHWNTLRLRDINSISHPLYVQVLTKSGGTTKGEKVYTVLGGEIQLALNDNIEGITPSAFRLLPTEEKMAKWSTLSDEGNNPKAQVIIDEMNPLDFEVDIVSQGEPERRVLFDALSRNAEGTYKPHGALDVQEEFAQDMIDKNKSMLAVPTTAIDGELYCVLCKRGIQKKTEKQQAAIKKKLKTEDVPIWKLQKYEVDHIFNLIFNTLCNLNGGPGGFFDTCSSCNQTFKSEKLWCPNYDIWDGLLQKMLAVYDPKLGLNIENLRSKYQWPGLKCQGVTINKQQNRAPYGGWRTFITGWSAEEKEEEDAVLVQLAGDFGVTVNKGEFGKAQALKYTGGSNRPAVPPGAAGYLSTYVLQDCFLRRVLYVVYPDRDKNEVVAMGEWMSEAVDKDCKYIADVLAASFAETSLDMMSTWKEMKKKSTIRTAAMTQRFKKAPYSPSVKKPQSSNTTGSPLGRDTTEAGLPLSQNTKNLWKDTELGIAAQKLRMGSYLISKNKEQTARSLRILGEGGDGQENETTYLREINNLREVIKSLKSELKRWGGASLVAKKEKIALLKEHTAEYERVMKKFEDWNEKEQKRLEDAKIRLRTISSSSEGSESSDDDDVMAFECKTPGGGDPSFDVESMEGEIRALRQWFADGGGVGLGVNEPYDEAKREVVEEGDLTNTEESEGPIHWWSGQLMLEALNSFCLRCNWQPVKQLVADDSGDEDVICIFEDRNGAGKTKDTTDIKIELNNRHWVIFVRPNEDGNLTRMPSVGDENHTVYAHHRNNGDCGPAAVALAIRACNDMDQLTQGMMFAVAKNADLAEAQARELERLATENAKNEKERTKAKFKERISRGIQELLRDKNAEKGLPLDQIKTKLYQKQIGKGNDLPNDNDLGTEFLTYINSVLTDLIEAGKVERVGRSTHNPNYKLIIKKRGMSNSSSGASASLRKKSKEGGKSKTKGGKRTRKKRRRKKKSRRKRKYRKKTKKRKRRRKKRTRRK